MSLESLFKLRESLAVPVITDDFARRVNKIAGNFRDGLVISNLYHRELADPVPEELEEWDNFYRGLSPKEKVALSSSLKALIRSQKFETVGDVREISFKDLANLNAKRMGLLRVGFLKAIFEPITVNNNTFRLKVLREV